MSNLSNKPTEDGGDGDDILQFYPFNKSIFIKYFLNKFFIGENFLEKEEIESDDIDDIVIIKNNYSVTINLVDEEDLEIKQKGLK